MVLQYISLMIEETQYSLINIQGVTSPYYSLLRPARYQRNAFMHRESYESLPVLYVLINQLHLHYSMCR